MGSADSTPGPLTEGELWTAEALLELRRGRYHPAAWSEFIRRSLERADETRRACPALAREARRWGVIGAAAWLAACRLATRHSSVSLNPWPGLLWWHRSGRCSTGIWAWPRVETEGSAGAYPRPTP